MNCCFLLDLASTEEVRAGVMKRIDALLSPLTAENDSVAIGVSVSLLFEIDDLTEGDYTITSMQIQRDCRARSSSAESMMLLSVT